VRGGASNLVEKDQRRGERRLEEDQFWPYIICWGEGDNKSGEGDRNSVVAVARLFDRPMEEEYRNWLQELTNPEREKPGSRKRGKGLPILATFCTTFSGGLLRRRSGTFWTKDKRREVDWDNIAEGGKSDAKSRHEAQRWMGTSCTKGKVFDKASEKKRETEKRGPKRIEGRPLGRKNLLGEPFSQKN